MNTFRIFVAPAGWPKEKENKEKLDAPNLLIDAKYCYTHTSTCLIELLIDFLNGSINV